MDYMTRQWMDFFSPSNFVATNPEVLKANPWFAEALPVVESAKSRPVSAQYPQVSDAVRGSMSALPVGPGGGDEFCFDNLAGGTLIDATVPSPGTGFWYLSRGENACGNGTYGRQGVRGTPGAPRATTTCP